MKHEHVFRQSWLSTYFECPEQSRLVLTGQYPYDQTEAAAKGTAVHAAIEAVLTNGTDRSSALQVGVDAFRQLSSHEGFRWVQVKREKTALEHIQGGFYSWHRLIYPTLKATIWCEEPFEFVFHEDAERVIKLRGCVDYADVDGLEDWKLTGNQDKYGRDAWKLQKYDVQPSVYAVAARRAGLYGPRDVVPFRWVALSPLGRAPQVVDAVRTYGDELWLREQLVSLARHIEQGTAQTWPLRDQSPLCSEKWCMAWPTCKGAFVTIS